MHSLSPLGSLKKDLTIMVLQVKDGDRIQEENGEQIVITPQDKINVHNFGPASSRDDIVNTCQRPGGETADGNKIDATTSVDEWMQFMSTKGIKHAFILLSDNELEDYIEPGLISAYEAVGITAHHNPIASKGSYQQIMADLDSLYDKGEKAVAHCTHGMGRSGRVAAGWLVYKYGLTSEAATEEVLESARMHGVERMGAPRLLNEWIAN
jgi:protein tyrosine phosphatase (PTP) superfamily phosphohydrolase (DUF442 family)